MESPHKQVFIYYPNLIGYLRIILLLIAFYFATDNYLAFLFFYVLSFGLDVVDGYVARKFQQTSRFGAALDIFTDKLSTPGLLLTLSHLYPTWTFFLTCVLMLDVSSHYFHFYSTLLRGVTSHKIIDPSKKRHIYWLLVFFYSYKPYFVWTCLGFESFLVLLYINSFVPSFFAQCLLYATLPSFISKNLVHVSQLLSSVDDIAKYDWDNQTHHANKSPSSQLKKERR